MVHASKSRKPRGRGTGGSSVFLSGKRHSNKKQSGGPQKKGFWGRQAMYMKDETKVGVEGWSERKLGSMGRGGKERSNHCEQFEQKLEKKGGEQRDPQKEKKVVLRVRGA